MTVLATYNIKGGVGKTASTVNLAWLSATGGARTLIWDLDPQGASSFYFRVKPKVKGGGKKLLQKKLTLRSVIKATDYDDLDLLPADFSYRHLDLSLEYHKKPWRRLSKILTPLQAAYDNVFIDCPPGISLLAECVMKTVTVLLVPIIPTTLSVRTFRQLDRFVARGDFGHLRVLPFFTMLDRRKKLHLDTIRCFFNDHPAVLRTCIASASDIERMGPERNVLGGFAPRSPSLSAYRVLWNEINHRLSAQANDSSTPAASR